MTQFTEGKIGTHKLMPATVTYNTINGKIYSETRNGVSTAFVSDPLGNVIKCRDSEGNQTYEAWYWPYGEIREETGTNPSNLGYVGTLGYYTDPPMPPSTSPANGIYVRARYYRHQLTRWQTLDRMWPDELSYGYVNGNPTSDSDSTGQNPLIPASNKPCRFSPITRSVICDLGGKGCIDRTNGYGNSFLHTGNKFERCASCVSAAICDAVAVGNVGSTIFAGTGDPSYVPAQILTHCVECMGNCMFNLWKHKGTPAWHHAVSVCKHFGQRSAKCCIASVLAEQQGYTSCAKSCSCSFMNAFPYRDRIIFATNVLHCCS